MNRAIVTRGVYSRVIQGVDFPQRRSYAILRFGDRKRDQGHNHPGKRQVARTVIKRLPSSPRGNEFRGGEQGDF